MTGFRNGVRPRPRCGKPLAVRRLASRVREYDFGVVQPVCGLPENHGRTSCLSEESVRRLRAKRQANKDWGNR